MEARTAISIIFIGVFRIELDAEIQGFVSTRRNLAAQLDGRVVTAFRLYDPNQAFEKVTLVKSSLDRLV